MENCCSISFFGLVYVCLCFLGYHMNVEFSLQYIYESKMVFQGISPTCWKKYLIPMEIESQTGTISGLFGTLVFFRPSPKMRKLHGDMLYGPILGGSSHESFRWGKDPGYGISGGSLSTHITGVRTNPPKRFVGWTTKIPIPLDWGMSIQPSYFDGHLLCTRVLTRSCPDLTQKEAMLQSGQRNKYREE